MSATPPRGDASARGSRALLPIDGLILCLAEALLDADRSCGRGVTPSRFDGSVLARARSFLDAETTRVIRSSELEEVTGLTRYDLARQFRSAFGTSEYRYSLMRRLDCARASRPDPRAGGARRLRRQK